MTKVIPSIFKTKEWKELIKEFEKLPYVNVKPRDENNKEDIKKAKQLEKLFNYMFKNNTNGIRSEYYDYMIRVKKQWVLDKFYEIQTNVDNVERTIAAMAKELGKRGGKVTLSKLGLKHFKRISKLGVKARKHETG